MATGTGKTVVMAMLIAWLTVNKVHAPRDTRFAKRFLVVAPGITIRDRLGVLRPEREDSYYRERDLVPPDLWEAVLQAQVEIVNYHAFLPKDAKEIKGVSKTTRALLRGNKPEVADAFKETPELVAARILKRFGSGKGEIVVLNDEAHHCYQDKLLEHPDEDAEKEDEERNREARVWFRGIADLHQAVGIKTVYDLSATPYYLKGSGYNEGFIFPWVVSDFSLMDAIESGIVKVPRIPVDDDAPGRGLAYRDLWDKIDPPLPEARARNVDFGAAGWPPPRDARRRTDEPVSQLRADSRRLRGGAGGARRAAAGDDRGLPEHRGLEAGLRVDRRPRIRARRWHEAARARQSAAAEQRRRRRVDDAPAHARRRLGPDRVGRAA